MLAGCAISYENVFSYISHVDWILIICWDLAMLKQKDRWLSSSMCICLFQVVFIWILVEMFT